MRGFVRRLGRAAARFPQVFALATFLAGSLLPARASIAPHPVSGLFAPVVDSVAVEPRLDWAWMTDQLEGRSGALRALMVLPGDTLLSRLASLDVVHPGAGSPGVHALPGNFSLITLLPFEAKQGPYVDQYRVGRWPYERRAPRSGAYANPLGFIRVTAENQDTPISRHFRLRDFLTHDQARVWPKALVLRPELIDKLELVIADLEANGVPVRHVEVLSGFRHPHYNARGVGAGGRARDSRHQYGDAADIFVDNDQNGRMDDLNRDGRVNLRDVRVILAAVERVERAHPELVGGAGLYPSTGAHGPFAHIDARGRRARWGA
jgi:uncharacterized protein YcbK (DUF882 family)